MYVAEEPNISPAGRLDSLLEEIACSTVSFHLQPCWCSLNMTSTFTRLIYGNTTEEQNSGSDRDGFNSLHFDVISGSPLLHNKCFQRLCAAPPGQELTQTDSRNSNHGRIGTAELRHPKVLSLLNVS